MARGGPAKGRSLRVGGVALLILFSALSVSPSPVERRNGPIRLRENLWATGRAPAASDGGPRPPEGKLRGSAPGPLEEPRSPGLEARGAGSANSPLPSTAF